MSGAATEYYAVFLIWLGIVSIYTTLLTLTALGVVFILRKRRSSILKSQRPPRTPFSELEFKVDTPTDVTKSRRVSFSRRTGVAEFATNEATTTWKTFYEEHNKSLESSSNDSEVKVLKQSIGHLGNRCFDDQFQDIEADIDYVNAPGNPRNISIDISANLNLAEQLEITENGKNVTAPHQNFELSSFTDRQTKLFGDELTNPIAVKMSEQIDIDFSIMQHIGDDIVEDDLDDIQNDVKQAHINMINNRSDVSQYIKVDFNTTQVVGTNDESDMSITDTVHSPKVQENRSNSSIKSEKSVTINKDWVTDKENILFNPYAAPAKKFVVNEEPSKVLVFDGKRVTVQSETMVPTKQNPSKEAGKQRRTIVLNVDDDLPNFIDQDISNIIKNKNIAYNTENHRHTIISSNDNDLSMTQAIVNNIDLAEAEVAYQNSFGNMSMTQGIPDIVKLNENSIANGKTTVFNSDSGDISFTQAVPSKIVLSRLKSHIAETLESKTDIDGTCNVSITQAVPNNVNLAHKNTQIDREKRRTIVYENDACDISMTQAVPSHIILADKNVPLNSEKGKTILYEKDDGDISITQALPSYLILLEKAKNSANKNKTLVFDDNDIVGNISVTQTLPANIIIEKNKKDLNKSNLNATETSSISLTQMVPEHIILSEKTTGDKRKTIYDADKDISMIQTIPNNLILSAKAEVYDDNYIGNMSMTSAFPANIILPNDEKLVTENRKTIVFDDDAVNVSITQALSGNILVQTQVPNALRRHTLISQDTDVSMTEVISNRIIENNIANLVLNDSHEDDMDMSITQHVPQERNETAPKDDSQKLTISKAYINESCGISMTQAVPNNIIIADDNSTEIDREKRRTVLYDNDSSNLSMTKPIPTELVTLQDEFLESNANKNAKDTPHSAFHSSMGQDIIVYQAVTDSSVTNVALKKTEQGDSENQELLKNYSYVIPPMSSADEKVADENASYNLLENHGNEDKSMMEVDDVEEQKEGIVKTEVNSKLSYVVDKTEIESKISDVKSIEIFPAKTSILNDLLDMSNASLVDGIDDKNIMTKIVSETPSNVSKTDKDASNESLFYIIRDCDDDVQTDNVNNDKNQDESIHSDQKELGEGRKSLKFSDHVQEIVEGTPLPLEYVQESEPGVERDLKDNLTKLQSILDESPPAIMQEIDAADADVSDNLNESRANEMQVKECDDTKELLEMLSNFTGPQKTFNEINDEADEPAIVKEHIALEDKNETFGAKRYSLAPSRLSIVLSKEDMMNNISMAKAMLQKSRLEMDSSDYMQESTINTPAEQCSSHKKSVRLSNDVVKTLHFEDESKSEISMESEEKLSPVRKTVFGETSYMQDNKAKVIPSYLKDVSDGIKELMLDLVKPMADVMPFEAAAPDKSLNRNPSTCSTQIQANLVTSSQVDLEGELQSAAESYSEVNKMQSLTTEIAKMGDKAVTQALKSYHSEYSTKCLESEVNSDSNCQVTYIQPKIQQHHKSPQSGRVLYFDPSNPLNNVMLTPVDFSDAHRYNPIESAESLAASEQSDSLHAASKDKGAVDAERVSIQYNLDKVTLSSAVQHSGDALSDSVEKSNSLVSNVSKRTSIDQAIDVKMTDVKDMDCNTVIVMKGNKELLDASSSLTLVDDALTHKAFDVDIESPSNSSQDENASQSRGKSPVELIYKVNKQDKNKTKRVDSDLTSEYDDEPARPLKKAAKAKKRSYSPTKRDKHKHCTLSSLDVTPKPLSKIVRRSDSPASLQMNAENESQNKLIAERDTPNDAPETEQASRKTSKDASRTPEKKSTPEKKKKSPRRSKDSPKKEKPGTTITVQRLLTEFKMKDRIDEKKLNEEILAALSKESSAAMESESSEVCVSKSPEVVSSCTSSKNQSEMRAQRSCVSTDSRATSKPSSSCAWDPAPAPAAAVPAAPALVTECESSVNVVAKIDMLPFMGTHECEWESSIGDTWSFRLLHARLRLSVRLEHRHDNALRTRVLADTPVRAVTIETVVHDKKNSVAVLCVRYAAEAMRFWVGRGCARAHDVVALLQRCAGVARVALRWGRAMQEAYAHLAYSLTDDGRLSLKVANVPLRSVWEVTMRLELVVEDARETPWPRAGDVRVAAVVSDVRVRDHDVQRAVRPVRHDWGHAPRTIWRIFKYLKNKTRDDDLLLGLC